MVVPMTDLFTEAWEEANATPKPGVMIFCTLEFRHPAFVDEVEGVFAVRVVTGTSEDQALTLEDEAAVDAGEEVTFKACPFQADMPSYEEGKTPECSVVVDNVGREMIPYLEQAVRMRADLTATYREYRSDDRTAPCYGPVTFTIKAVKVSKTRLQGLARIDDLANRKFPSLVYTYRDHPGLAAA